MMQRNLSSRRVKQWRAVKQRQQKKRTREKKWRSGYHSKANISFLEGGAVVGTVSCHCNHLSGFAHCAVDDAWSAEWHNKKLCLSECMIIQKKKGEKSRSIYSSLTKGLQLHADLKQLNSLLSEQTHLWPECVCLWVMIEPEHAAWAKLCPDALVPPRNDMFKFQIIFF